MKQLLVFLLFLCSASVSAQDVIVKKDGSTVVCRVVEVNATEIVYKKWSDLNGSNYVMERSSASAINYESGKKVDLSEVDNQYLPHNQNTGEQQYNDNALLAIDRASHPKWKRKFKWNLRAAYAMDFYNMKFDMAGKEENLKTGSSFDVGAGLVFPLKDENMFIGGDFGFSILTIKWTLDDGNAVAPFLYFAPYWGYKFMIGKNISIAPYVGPYVGLGLDDEDIFYYNDDNGDCKEAECRLKEDFQFGLHLGAKLFLSSNFYFDLHCMKSFSNVGGLEGHYGSSWNYGVDIDKDFKMFSLMLGLGVQF